MYRIWYYFQVIRKSCDSVFNALVDILRERITRDIKHEVSLCIGVLGYIVSMESSRFWNTLISCVVLIPSLL